MGKLDCQFYVRDKESGRIHKVGTDPHDSIFVDAAGELHYFNMQNGDGCSGKSHIDNRCGYEFVQSENGKMTFEAKGGNVVALDTGRKLKGATL